MDDRFALLPGGWSPHTRSEDQTMTLRRSITLTPDEEQLIRTMYYEARIPTDQYPRRPRRWRQFVAIWNEATSRDDSPEEVLHWLVTRRKRPDGRPGRLEAIGGDHKKLQSPGAEILTEEQWEVLDAIYVEMGVGSDNFVFDPELKRRLVREFLRRTRVHVPATKLIAALIARRKGGFLARIDDLGFRDIDQVGG